MNFRPLTSFAPAVLILGASLLSTTSFADDVAEGKKIAFDRKLGNCLACHMIEGGNLPGNIGPPLIAMKARFPNKFVLEDQIYDATEKNPNSMMPPFGKHGILTEEQISLVVEYIHTL